MQANATGAEQSCLEVALPKSLDHLEMGGGRGGEIRTLL